MGVAQQSLNLLQRRPGGEHPDGDGNADQRGRGLNNDDITTDYEAGDGRGWARVTDTKFGKSRLVPLHATTMGAIRRYQRLRDRTFPVPKTTAVFVAPVAPGSPARLRGNTFREIRQEACLGGSRTRSTATVSSRPSLRHCRAIVPGRHPATVRVRGNLLCLRNRSLYARRFMPAATVTDPQPGQVTLLPAGGQPGSRVVGGQASASSRGSLHAGEPLDLLGTEECVGQQ